MVARLWAWIIGVFDPDRFHKLSGYAFLILALSLLLIVVLGWGNTPRWQGWGVQ